jgi:hypothetical protein
MRINDVTVRQKTDNAKLTALISNLGIFSVDMEKADAKVTFKMSPNNEEGTFC